MKSIEFIGAAGGEVTGSAFIATTNNDHKILIDCGAFQGQRKDKDDKDKDNFQRNKNLDIDTSQLNGVIITHGHLDHIGRLPLLYNSPVPIYMTQATYDLAQITLRNSAALSPGLYPEGSIDAVLGRTIRVDYDQPFPIDGAMATLKDAGHILGSSSVQLKEKCGETVVISGDLGNSPSRLVKPTSLIKEADIVVMETTYGDRSHCEDSPSEVIMDAIERIKKTKGTLLIPTFAIDRTQMVLNIFKELRKNKQLGTIPVFLDSPMAMAVTDVYRNHRQLLNEEIKSQDDPFDFPGLTKTFSSRESNAIHNRKSPKVIIAGSGMMSGGRIGKHAEYYLPDPKNVILFVGYAAKGTPSREIVSGEKKVFINEGYVNINSTVLQTSSLSAHADKQQLTDWFRDIQGGERYTRSLFLVHGDQGSREAFANHIKAETGFENIILPEEKTIFDLQKNTSRRN